jgi:hypothetical protein
MNRETNDRPRTTTTWRELLCPRCERGYLILRQCKLLCERCGYVESCEDSFLPMQANPFGEITRN